jgi:SAM-dependent methyltransferase
MTQGGHATSTVCPLCLGACSRPFFERDGHVFMECAGCRTLFLRTPPDPEALTRLYVDPGPERGSALCWEVEARHDTPSFAKVLDLARRRGGTGPVLDVGCGNGLFLAYARDGGWTDLTGLEVSPTAAASARHRLPEATVLQVPLDAADLPQEHFAVIGLWDVLEHLPSPRRALLRVTSLLRPGGLVVVSTPNRFGLAIRLLGRRSVVVCPPEHLFLASRAGLGASMAAAGLSVESVWSEDLRIREWTRWLARPGHAPDDRRRYLDVQGRLAASRWLQHVRALVNVGLRAGRIGDQLLAIASRPN